MGKLIVKKFEEFITLIEGKRADRIAIILYSIASILSVYNIARIYNTYLNVFNNNKLPQLVILLELFIPIGAFYVSMCGEVLGKAYNRTYQFLIMIVSLMLIILGYLVQLNNISFVSFVSSIQDINVVPRDLLIGNIRTISLFVPILLVILVFTPLLSVMFFNKKFSSSIANYKVSLFRPVVYKSSANTIDIKLCNNYYNNEDIYLYEKLSKEHVLIQGGSGSGKTATILRPNLNQYFKYKSRFIENEKKLVYEALEEGLCYLNKPFSNEFINENFSMDMVTVKPDKEEAFTEKLKDYIVGVRNSEIVIYNANCTGQVTIPCTIRANGIYNLKITVLNNSCILYDRELTFTETSIPDSYTIEDIHINMSLESKITDDNSNILNLSLDDNYTFNIRLVEKTKQDIIYKNLGVTVVAPDGGLPSDTVKIANMHNIKVHKIDPKEEEIQKGGIAQYNPLLDGTPEKCGDIISSILVSMDNDDGNNKGNSYFVNAGVRAIRNIVILLKVMYPKVYNTNPTLDDVLALLNDFDKVVPLVEEMKKDPYLNNRWRTVIVYFETRFYPVPTDDKGKPIFGARLGSKRTKTEESIEGIVNQLDNFLGREEIRYILCDRENSISLEEVLENGDCLAIASRQAELGDKLGKAFALFFILSIQNAVLSRYSEDENPTIPHFILIDEFPFYLNDSTKTFFSFSRKYNCSINVVIQNMAQLREVSDEFRQIIFTNTGTKILLGGINAEDQKYWSDLFGTEEKLELQTGFSKNPLLSENGKMTESIRGSIKESAKVTTQELNELEFKNVYCMYKNNKGERVVAKGYTDFLNISDKKEDKEYFNFEKFNKNSFKPITNVEEPKEETFENIEEPKKDSVADHFISLDENEEVEKDSFPETFITEESKDEIKEEIDNESNINSEEKYSEENYSKENTFSNVPEIKNNAEENTSSDYKVVNTTAITNFDSIHLTDNNLKNKTNEITEKIGIVNNADDIDFSSYGIK